MNEDILAQDRQFMLEALKEAKKASELGEVPVGAVVVKNGVVIGRGHNRRETDKNAVSHAEINAIEEACRNAGGWRLWDCELYVTLEPCPMCAGAAINSRIKRVVFGAYDKKAGSCGSVTDLFELPFNHRPELTAGISEKQCAEILSDFFRSRRDKKNSPEYYGTILSHDFVLKDELFSFEALNELKINGPVFLLSCIGEEETKTVLSDRKAESCFDGIFFCKNDPKSKTDALRMIVRRFSLKGAVYAGCGDSDRSAAQTAGIEYVHAAYSHSKTRIPTRQIKTLSELTELQKIIFS